MTAERGEMPSGIEKEQVEVIETKPVPEKATETELVLHYIEHIDHPCGVEVAPGQVENLRESYLIRARELLPKLTNPHAKRLLEINIEEYTDK